MKIKKYMALSEQDALQKVKNELGPNALILSTKRIKPKGFFGFFKQSKIEVTAAYDDTESNSKKEKATKQEIEAKHRALIEQQEKIKLLEHKLGSTEEMLKRVKVQLSVAEQSKVSQRIYENSMIQFFYDSLIEQDVYPEVASSLLESIDIIEDANQININLIVKIVYNTIVNILSGTSDKSNIFYDNMKNYCFAGPTGVGKTTTIAKLCSNLVLRDAKSVGLITADTYRIAAIEQLKTYAEILGIDVSVIYNADELLQVYKDMQGKNDFVLIDTAGRSHKNSENLEDLIQIIKAVPDVKVFLVLSLTTKLADILNIIKTYSAITDFSLILTKLDETTTYGSILNIAYLTKKKIAFLTTGQNVPDDIETVEPEKIAKILLGLGG